MEKLRKRKGRLRTYLHSLAILSLFNLLNVPPASHAAMQRERDAFEIRVDKVRQSLRKAYRPINSTKAGDQVQQETAQWYNWPNWGNWNNWNNWHNWFN